MTVAPSLFDAPSGSALTSASKWLSSTLLGSLAIGLCVIAVAWVGLLLMSGRLAVRDALRITIGCFVLLGAPVIAAGLHGLTETASRVGVVEEPRAEPTPQPPPLPPANYDPYAGASLRVE
ncbi:TrbC/VirB2 family protein [Croceibacterium sp. LX-88]|uniref:TrbC/VirB2 family protein n=1 Tax=Croceibacterium selenioxidans TaxID=2838833 RepID=A0ABS5W5I7_9SPHN|nr:TrbC/VirB2 family protein [Croceibacterium selenioxidans]MBT2134490.1 TrbC/VirB2 family protein [Croceibacterium selenioxidans]